MITYHHIGGRSGTFPIPLKDLSFSKDVHLILYDADPDCIDHIKHAENSSFGKVSVFPYCVGEKRNREFLNINFHPTTSSLYPFDETFKDYNYIGYSNYGEYRLGDACKMIKSIPMDLLSLEDACTQSNIKEIDFLSLDIQGTEYDVLKGSHTFIENNCVGIQVEVEFAKIYKGQKGFFEVNQLLEEMGYELIELDSFTRLSPLSIPIGFRGLEAPLYAEAVYIKKLSLLKQKHDHNKLYKLALFCLINKKMGLCIQVLNILNTLTKISEINESDSQYVSLLKTIWQMYSNELNIYLPKMSELYSKEMLSAYYRGIPNTDKQFDNERNENKITLNQKYHHQLNQIRSLAKTDFTSLELFLNENGLGFVSEAIKRNRNHEASCLLNLLHSTA